MVNLVGQSIYFDKSIEEIKHSLWVNIWCIVFERILENGEREREIIFGLIGIELIPNYFGCLIPIDHRSFTPNNLRLIKRWNSIHSAMDNINVRLGTRAIHVQLDWWPRPRVKCYGVATSASAPSNDANWHQKWFPTVFLKWSIDVPLTEMADGTRHTII